MNNKYNWDNLTHLQLGQYAEYFTKMEFTLYGFDVYTSEVDDKGIDFVINKKNGEYFEIQVKSIRINKTKYVFMQKDKFNPKSNLLLSLVIFTQNESPDIYLIPSLEWKKQELSKVFTDKDYEGKQSKPEYGINISKTNIDNFLKQYEFDNIIQQLNKKES